MPTIGKMIEERKKLMTKEDILTFAGIFPLTEKSFQIHGHKENGVNYCVISRYKNNGLIHSKIEHMVTDDLNSLDLTKTFADNSLVKPLDNKKLL